MMEISPSSLKLNDLHRDRIADAIESLPIRYVDVKSRQPDDVNAQEPWVNDGITLVVEVQRPTAIQMANLVCMTASVQPKSAEFMRSQGESYIIFRWVLE